MRDPQWAVSRLRSYVDRIDRIDHSGAGSARQHVLTERADNIARIQQELVAALLESSDAVRLTSKHSTQQGEPFITSDEARDFSDGIFDQRSYREH